MKLLTLNTHSWLEENSDFKFKILTDIIEKEKFDIIALQEVNQSIDAQDISNEQKISLGFIKNCSKINIKKNNFALNIVEKLYEQGLIYYWSWVPNHIGYDKFDEGVAILTSRKVLDISTFRISNIVDYNNYKTRKTIGLKVALKERDAWFFSMHMGWWNDVEEPFKNQWENIDKNLQMYKENDIYLMGDFNNPSHIKDEGYDYICKNTNFFDTFNLAKEKDFGITVINNIDGWKNTEINKMRIDYIFKSNNKPIKKSKVIFNGENYPVISDHFGVFIEDND